MNAPSLQARPVPPDRANARGPRQARPKDTLSAEDLGILLQWHWKYGTAAFTNERQRVQLSLLMLFSAFTGSRPDTLLGDNSLSNALHESLGQGT